MTAMAVTYEPWLVLLSIVMAIQGAYVGLSLAVQVGEAHGGRRRLLLAGATASLAVAIWTMHFVGMLAVRLPFPVDYLALPTLLSFLVCAIVVGTAVYATSAGPFTLLRLTLSACLMGGGIFAMHYIGMNALDASALMIHDPPYVAGSMAIAIAASGLALWLAAGRGGRPPLILSATAFGVAVSGMHYTAMTGVTLYSYSTAAFLQYGRAGRAGALHRSARHCCCGGCIWHFRNISVAAIARRFPVVVHIACGWGR
jgi:NO-binding membrane sensor protein with MHYT domain